MDNRHQSSCVFFLFFSVKTGTVCPGDFFFKYKIMSKEEPKAKGRKKKKTKRFDREMSLLGRGAERRQKQKAVSVFFFFFFWRRSICLSGLARLKLWTQPTPAALLLFRSLKQDRQTGTTRERVDNSSSAGSTRKSSSSRT